MSIFSNVTEKDLDNLRKLAEQQKNERALKIRNKFLKQTHDKTLAESLSPITNKLDETTEKLGEVIKESQPKTPQLAIANTQTPAIESTTTSQSLPIENERIQPGVLYETSLENTLSNMKNNSGFFNIEETDDDEIFWNGFPVEKMGGNKLKICGKIHNITPSIQKVLTETSNIPLKKLNDKDNDIFINILEKYFKAIRGESK